LRHVRPERGPGALYWYPVSRPWHYLAGAAPAILFVSVILNGGHSVTAKVVSRAILLIAVSAGAALSQIAASRVASCDAVSLVGTAKPATPDLKKTFTYETHENGAVFPDALWRFNERFLLQAPAGPAKAVTPFTYALGANRVDQFRLDIGPLRYTFWSRNSPGPRPVGGRLQTLIDGVRRHYTSRPVIAVNNGCVRMLACNSMYEQALHHRSATPLH